MAKNNFLVLIRKRIEEIHKEYSALRTAYDTLEKVSGLRGRKVSIPELSDLLENNKPEKQPKKGKRGRPRKNPFTEIKNSTNETEKPKGKRGRKKVIKSTLNKEGGLIATAKDTSKIKEKSLSNKSGKRPIGRPKLIKEVKKIDKKNKSKTASASEAKKSVKGSSKRTQKTPRTRVPNLASRITEIIKASNRFVTNAEITDKLASTYPSKDKAQLSKYLSVVMAQMKGRKEAGVIVKDHQGKRMRSGLWGLPNWFENGKPKNEYLK